MSYQPGQSGKSGAITRFLIGFALIEGAVLAALVLAMVFGAITTGQMVAAMVAVVIIGALVMSARLLSLLREQRNRLARARENVVGETTHLTSGQGDVSDASRLGINKLGDPDPMAKFRDPNS
ncbi:hypothetical protein LQF12_14160 [Ruania suaedae]|uniref:hypothetical protein n=1 Tax=Ruania suaedae TaxID=2897774 RepID=UPI001E60FA92|nr:hypothetical protein [Ruania suaedae]UFU02617.1 hypothetical protein LQF12_14160 [Ruania suaedae]